MFRESRYFQRRNADDVIKLIRGCRDGVITDETGLSECTMDCDSSNACDSSYHCDSCARAGGPDEDSDGCYWDPALDGECGYYWSSSDANLYDEEKCVRFNYGDVGGCSSVDEYQTLEYVRCVRSHP